MIRWPFYRSWRRDAEPQSLAQFDAWVRNQRRALGWRAGLEISWTSISRHWPYLLCGLWWSIALRWQPYGYMGALGEYADHPMVVWKAREDREP